MLFLLAVLRFFVSGHWSWPSTPNNIWKNMILHGASDAPFFHHPKLHLSRLGPRSSAAGHWPHGDLWAEDRGDVSRSLDELWGDANWEWVVRKEGRRRAKRLVWDDSFGLFWIIVVWKLVLDFFVGFCWLKLLDWFVLYLRPIWW